MVASRARVLLEVGLMRSGAQAPRGGGGGGAFSKRTLSGYMRIMSSGASTAASSLLSVGASLVNSIASHDEDGSRDQVISLDFKQFTVLVGFFGLCFTSIATASLAIIVVQRKSL